MSSEYLDIARICAGIAILAYASMSDVRTRTVPDKGWIALCAIAGVILALQMYQDSVPWAYYLVFVPILIILLDTFDVYDVLKGRIKVDLFYPLVPVGIIVGALTLYLGGMSSYGVLLLVVPMMMVLAYFLYSFRILHGGGDAKAFIAISLLHPFYPIISRLPLIHPSGPQPNAESFGLSIITVFYAALIVVIVFPLYYLFKNPRGDRKLPNALFGYRMKIEDAKKAFVWPMEVLKEGKLVLRLYPGEIGRAHV
jgi:Flp pilus assembly protein protease CpaA